MSDDRMQPGARPDDERADRAPAGRESADRELDALFGATLARTRAPAGFAGRLMARVALEPRALAVAGPPVPAVPAPEPEFAWWLRAAAHPAVALSFAIAGIVAAWPRAIAQGGAALALGAAGGLDRGWLALQHAIAVAAPALRDPLVSGVLLALAAAGLAWPAWSLARATERLTHRLAGPVA